MARNPHDLEQWLPLYIRVVGIILGIALVTATIFGEAGLDFAGAYVFVTGMIFYKNVHDYRGRGDSERGDSDRG